MLRSLPPLNVTGASPALAMVMDHHRAPSPLPPIPSGQEISRPSSTSTQSSNALAFQQSQAGMSLSLPGLSTLAAVASAPNPHLRAPMNAVVGHQLFQTTASPTPTSVSGQSNPPICQNCSTSTTPLWRRDELGSVLCNACGLFLKLHGRPRPISLKTDVIKSRNRVKSSQQQKKKPVYFGAGFPTARSEGGSPPPGFRRISNRSCESDRSHSPISRTTTPAMLGMPHHMFDPTGMEHAFGPPGRSPSLPTLHFRQPSPSGYMDRHLQPPPHPFDGLQMANTELKTKVSELEVINGLFNDRVRQLESEHRQSLQREEDYKRLIAQLQDELAFFRRSSGGSKRSMDDDDDDSPFAKRSRISDISTFSILSNPTQPLSASTKS